MLCLQEPLAASVGEAKHELVAEFDSWLEAQGEVLPVRASVQPMCQFVQPLRAGVLCTTSCDG